MQEKEKKKKQRAHHKQEDQYDSMALRHKLVYEWATLDLHNPKGYAVKSQMRQISKSQSIGAK